MALLIILRFIFIANGIHGIIIRILKYYTARSIINDN